MSDGPLLVTGATGFVGSHVVEQALAAGHAVIATGRDAERFSDLPFAGGVRFIACDLHRDPAPLCAVANEVRALLHLAWPDLPDYRNPSHVTHHLGADARFLKQMVGAGLRRIVGVGTCLEYGLREGELSEDMPTDPMLPYPIAKDALRRLITMILDADTVSVAWARLFYMYGPRQNPGSLMALLDTAIERGDAEFLMSGGQQLRDYLPVEEVARRLIRLALADASGIFNVCSGDAVSVETLVRQRIAQMNANTVPKLGVYEYPDYEPMAFWGDSRRFEALNSA